MRTLRSLAALLPAMLALPLIVDAGAPPTTQLEITIRYSRFLPATIDVPMGRPITIVLRNEDPIDHEWIAGTAELHEGHRSGTEPVHDTRPTEVTVPALSTRVTTVTFAKAGTYAFVCHLPGHEAYGMVGTLRVR